MCSLGFEPEPSKWHVGCIPTSPYHHGRFTTFKNHASKSLEGEEICYFEDNFNELLTLSHVLFLDPTTYNLDITEIFDSDRLKLLENHFNKRPNFQPSAQLFEIATLLSNRDEDLEIKLCSLELKAIEKKDDKSKHLVQAVKFLLCLLPKIQMTENMLEHELRDSIIHPILNHFFSVQEKMKFRAPEQNLPERMSRTCKLKKPDAIVSTIMHTKFGHTRLIGETKNSSYNADSLLVLYDKYRLSLFAKDILDSNVNAAVLYQATGLNLSFYRCCLVEDAFYIVVHLFDVMLPSCHSQIPSFLLEINKLYQIKEILETECNYSSNTQTKSNWMRPTFDSPLFDDYVSTNNSHVPSKSRKRPRQDDGTYKP